MTVEEVKQHVLTDLDYMTGRVNVRSNYEGQVSASECIKNLAIAYACLSGEPLVTVNLAETVTAELSTTEE